MRSYNIIIKAAVLVAAALVLTFGNARAENITVPPPAKTEKKAKDPCAGHTDERSKVACQNGIKLNAADIAISKLITEINYRLISSSAKTAFEQAQEAWETFMIRSCDYETIGTKGGLWAQADEDFCRISYMQSRIKVLERYLDCKGTNVCPQ